MGGRFGGWIGVGLVCRYELAQVDLLSVDRLRMQDWERKRERKKEIKFPNSDLRLFYQSFRILPLLSRSIPSTYHIDDCACGFSQVVRFNLEKFICMNWGDRASLFDLLSKVQELGALAGAAWRCGHCVEMCVSKGASKGWAVKKREGKGEGKRERNKKERASGKAALWARGQ